MEFVYDPIKQFDYNKELRGRFNSFIVTEFDDSMTVEMQLRSIIKWVKQNINSISEMVGFINAFNEWLSSCGYEKHMIRVLDKWLDNGKLLKELLETLNFEYTIHKMEERIDELKDLFAEADFYSKAEIEEHFDVPRLSNNVYSSDVVRPIFNTAITDFNARLDNDYKESDFNMIFLTDAHANPMDYYWGGIHCARSSFSHIPILAEYDKKVDAIVFGGDNCDDNNPVTKENLKSYHKEYVGAIKLLLDCPTFLLKGNHDDNSVNTVFNPIQFDWLKSPLELVIEREEFKDLYHQDGSQGEMRRNGSNYFYKDYPDKKVRLIGLDSYDLNYKVITKPNDTLGLNYYANSHSEFSKEQIKWLVENALQTPDGYHVIITTHAPLQNTIVEQPSTTCVNHDKVKQIVEAFQQGKNGEIKWSETDYCDILTYDFSDKKDALVAVFNGHLHYQDTKEINGVLYISCIQDISVDFPVSEETSYHNTDKESGWTFIQLDTETRTLKTKCFGRGIDYTYTYGQVMNGGQ